MTLKINYKLNKRGEEVLYTLRRALHVTAHGRVVEETDPAGITVLGGAGSPVSEADVKKYGLDASHLEVADDAPPLPEPAPVPVPVVEPAPTPAVEPEPVVVPEVEAEPEELKGKLPEDFPGYVALAEAGVHTYGQLRKVENLLDIDGIGPVTVEKIAEALAQAPE